MAAENGRANHAFSLIQIVNFVLNLISSDFCLDGE